MRIFSTLFITLAVLVPVSSFAYYDPFYANVSSSEKLKENYQKGEARILIVPGHGQFAGGTEFSGVYERELNVAIAHYLREFLAEDKNLNIFVARDETGAYASWFVEYMRAGRERIIAAREEIIKKFRSRQSLGGETAKLPPRGVYHNVAPEQTAFELYALNQFANDNKIDIALHIHINDYPNHPKSSPGKHIGFTIYVPDKVFINSEASVALADYLRDQLSFFMPISTLPGEDTGVTLDRELIAIGSYGSRDDTALLIEYGYIYEPQFLVPQVRDLYFREVAYQTARAIKDFLANKTSNSTPTTSLRSSASKLLFSRSLKRGMKDLPDILALQFLLRDEGLYPPNGKSLRDCPINGNFGPCTETAVKLFQKKYAESVLAPANLTRPTGYVGPLTISKLNSLN